jgi:hypothetical protein
VSESAANWSFASQVNAKECAPRFDAESLQTSILDELTKGSQLICVSAANALLVGDPNYEIAYSLATQTDDFTIDPTTGCITALKRLDTSDSGDIDVVLLVQGRDNQGAVANMTVIVDLQQSDSSPLFAADGYNFTVAEDAAVDTLIATIVATDADTNTLRYSWLTQDPAFVVNSSSGGITVGQALDFETKSHFALLLRAQDNAGQFHITQVTINVSDVNEPPTFIGINVSSVAENKPAGTVVGMLTARDPEGGPFTFVVTSSSPFEARGNLLVTTQPLNFEQAINQYNVSVQCTDTGSLSYTTQLTISVTNVNEAPTNIQLGRTNFSESFPVGELTTVSVTDDDNSLNPSAQVVACSLADNNNGQFLIEDGILYLERAFDFETAPSVQLTVVCADNGRPSRFSEPATFTLTVTDANDGPEDIVFVADGDVIETTPLNVVIGQIQASDYDKDASSVVFAFPDSDIFGLTGTATCVAGPVRGRVCTQNVVLVSALDYERQTLERVRVFATDNNGGRTETTITVAVANGNDPVTGLTWDDDDNVAMENVTVGTIVGRLVVQDDDRDQIYNFTLLNATDILELVVDDTDPSKVLVKVKDPSAFDFEQTDSITFTIQVTDDETPPEVSVITQTIQLADEPLSASLDPNSYQTHLFIAEAEGLQGTIIGVISVKGNDQGLKVFPVLANNDYVGLKGDSLVLKKDLDFESVNELVLEVTIHDRNGPASAPTTIRVTIIDSAEPPEFEHDIYTAEISDDEATGTTVSVAPGPLVAVDPDTVPGPVTLSIDADGTDAAIRELFSLKDDGDLRLNTVPASLQVTAGLYVLVIKATEAGRNITRANVLVTVFDDCRDNLCIAGEQCVDAGLSNYRCCDDGATCIDKNNAILRNQQASTSKQGSNAGLVAGVVVAVAILLVLCICGFIYYQRSQADRKTFFDSDGGMATSTNPAFRPAPIYGLAASSNTVNDLSNPMYAEFYRPEMSRSEATAELQGAPSGSFFVRDSQATPGWFVLGVRTDTEVRHEKIRCTENQHYQMVTGHVPEEPAFPSMPTLMSHYAVPQDAVPFVLRFQHNPGYAAVTRIGTALPMDKAAPAVPLKESQVAAVSQLAQMTSQDIYSNTDDARVAMAAQVTDA